MSFYLLPFPALHLEQSVCKFCEVFLPSFDFGKMWSTSKTHLVSIAGEFPQITHLKLSLFIMSNLVELFNVIFFCVTFLDSFLLQTPLFLYSENFKRAFFHEPNLLKKVPKCISVKSEHFGCFPSSSHACSMHLNNSSSEYLFVVFLKDTSKSIINSICNYNSNYNRNRNKSKVEKIYCNDLAWQKIKKSGIK